MAYPDKINHSISHTAILILGIVRFSLGIIDKNALDAVFDRKIDWGIFDDLVQYHKLDSLINDKFSGSKGILFPETTFDKLGQAQRENSARFLLLSAKTIEISRNFHENQISMLVVKGLSVESWLYERPGIRASGDIDLFININDFSSALNCLISLGYDPYYLSGRLIPGSRLCGQITRSQKDLMFWHSARNVTVELHWRLSAIYSAYPLSFEEAWETRSELYIAGQAIQSLSKDLHAVYLCYHGSKHFWGKLFWLYDIAKLMLKSETDWRAFLYQTRRLKAESSVGLAMVLASRIFSVSIPEIIREHGEIIKNGEELSDEIYYQLLADIPSLPSDDSKTPASVRQELNWYSRIHPSRYHFLHEWFRYLVTPTIQEWTSLKLPDVLTPLYRVWRPVRLIFEGVSKLNSK